MKDVFAIKKTSPALQLSIQLTRVALGIAIDNLTDDSFRELLLSSPHKILSHVESIKADSVSDAAYDRICRISEDAEYDPGIAARESEAGVFLDLEAVLTRLRRELEAGQSYVAFEVTSRLRRQGVVTVVHVDEDQGAHTVQLPVISRDFIVEEYKSHASRLRLPRNRVVVDSVTQDSPSSSVASQLLDTCSKQNVDFLVLGTIGKGGPAIDQLGHVPREVLRFSPLPVVLVPPFPIRAVQSRSSVFIVAVDGSPVTARCLQAVLKLLRPSDTVRIIHFYKQPLIGEFDKTPFEHCGALLSTANINGAVEILPLEPGSTIAESIHEYTHKHAASHLLLGLSGAGTAALDKQDDQRSDHLENPIGRVTAAMLFSPRCTLCICP